MKKQNVWCKRYMIRSTARMLMEYDLAYYRDNQVDTLSFIDDQVRVWAPRWVFQAIDMYVSTPDIAGISIYAFLEGVIE